MKETGSLIFRQAVCLAAMLPMPASWRADLFERAYRRDPEPEYLYLKGLTLMSMGRNDEAAEIFRNLILTQSGDARIYYDLGAALFMLDKFEEAEAAFRACQKLDADYPNVDVALARAMKMVTAARRMVSVLMALGGELKSEVITPIRSPDVLIITGDGEKFLYPNDLSGYEGRVVVIALLMSGRYSARMLAYYRRHNAGLVRGNELRLIKTSEGEYSGEGVGLARLEA